MKHAITISTEIDRVLKSPALDAPLRIKALTALYFNRRHEHGDVGRLMLAIEMISNSMAIKLNDDTGFEEVWKGFDSQYSSVRTVAKSAMKIGYLAGKLDITK